MKVLDFLHTKIAETKAESAILWYNFNMTSRKIKQENYTPIQMKIPVDLEKILKISDPIYTFNEIMDQIDLQKYFVEEGNKMGRPKFDSVKLLKIILFAFMENGYPSVRNINKLCNTDIRFIWLLDGTPAPSHMTISNFINEHLTDNIQNIFNDINSYIFEIGTRQEYSVEYVDYLLNEYEKLMQVDTSFLIHKIQRFFLKQNEDLNNRDLRLF